MKTRMLVVLAVFAVVASVEAQTRTDIYDATAVQVDQVELTPLPDGGCVAQWCGSVPQVDGGDVVRGCTVAQPLKNAQNLNRCNTLAGNGVDRLLKALRFDVDAGQQ